MENRRELDPSLNAHTSRDTHTHTHSTSGMPTHHHPFSPLPYSMCSSPAVLIHWPSQELSFPSGQAQLQLGGERDGGIEGRKKEEKGEEGETEIEEWGCRVSEVSGLSKDIFASARRQMKEGGGDKSQEKVTNQLSRSSKTVTNTNSPILNSCRQEWQQNKGCVGTSATLNIAKAEKKEHDDWVKCKSQRSQ